MFELGQTAASFLQTLNWMAVGERLLWAIGGGVVSLLGAYVVLIRDVAFIRGTIAGALVDKKRLDKLEEDVMTIRLELADRSMRVATPMPPQQMS